MQRLIMERGGTTPVRPGELGMSYQGRENILNIYFSAI